MIRLCAASYIHDRHPDPHIFQGCIICRQRGERGDRLYMLTDARGNQGGRVCSECAGRLVRGELGSPSDTYTTEPST